MEPEFLEQLKQLSKMELSDSLPDTLNTECKMPSYLKEQMITRTKQPDIQMISAKKTFSKQMELFLYSCRVSVAMVASLLMIVTISASQSQLQNLYQQDHSVIQDIQQKATIAHSNTSKAKDLKPNIISQKISKSSQTITSWLQDFPDLFID